MKLAALVIPLLAAITLGAPLSKRATLIASYQSCLSEIHEATPNTASGCGPSGAVERVCLPLPLLLLGLIKPRVDQR
jgi:hypothetical protein